MNDKLVLILAGVAGAGLGAIFFGGLWWTLRKGMASASPALWFLASFLIRTGLVCAGFYFVGAGRWERLLACLLGFVAARLILVRLTRCKTKPSVPSTEGASHAP